MRADEGARTAGDAERRTAAAEQRLMAAEQHTRAAEDTVQALARQVTEMQAQIAALEHEVAAADNVRSFAAETEREIAALQRELRETRAKLTQMTLERDRLDSELRDLRENGDTNRRAAVKPGFDPDLTAQLDPAKYESLAVRTAQLEQHIAELERDDAALRRQLTDAQEQLRIAALDLGDDDDGTRNGDQTRTGNQLPVAEIAEHVNVLEESIDSLRANMRAASDETAVMAPSESVDTISHAVSQAAEQVERARAAIRALSASIGMS